MPEIIVTSAVGIDAVHNSRHIEVHVLMAVAKRIKS